MAGDRVLGTRAGQVVPFERVHPTRILHELHLGIDGKVRNGFENRRWRALGWHLVRIAPSTGAVHDHSISLAPALTTLALNAFGHGGFLSPSRRQSTDPDSWRGLT